MPPAPLNRREAIIRIGSAYGEYVITSGGIAGIVDADSESSPLESFHIAYAR